LTADVPELIEVEDSLEAIQSFFETQGWTDGLPIVPPTVERVQEMYQYIDHAPGDVIARLAPRNGEATVQRIAINAVMAGCRPEYMPVLITAVRAIEDPAFNLNGVQSTTHPCSVAIFVNGPVRQELSINSGHNCFGQGSRANASIGRAMRLILLNVGGGTPGEGDQSTQGTPAKYSFCAAENQEASPWPPFHVDYGFDAEDSTVIVMAAEAPHNVIDGGSTTALGVLESMADSMRAGCTNDIDFGRGNPLVAFGPEHAGVIGRDGLSRFDVQRYLWEKVRREPRVRRNQAPSPASAPRVGDVQGNPGLPHGERWIAPEPRDIFVIVAGGAGGHSSWIPSFGLMRSVISRIEHADGTPVRSIFSRS
jgi:hypothetical protein